MAKGISLHIGLNIVDPQHYPNWPSVLSGSEHDARDMQKIAKKAGFVTELLLADGATRAKVIRSIRNAATTLSKDDIFLVSFSGHGGSIDDENGDEVDHKDETWCLYDGQLLDDELSNLWAEFKAGVRILVIADSCHSGTSIKAKKNSEVLQSASKIKSMPPNVNLATYLQNKHFYDELKETVNQLNPIIASVLLLGACQDGQTTSDGSANSAYTKALKEVWDDGDFPDAYDAFQLAIAHKLPSSQKPSVFEVGSGASLRHQKPFTIN